MFLLLPPPSAWLFLSLFPCRTNCQDISPWQLLGNQYMPAANTCPGLDHQHLPAVNTCPGVWTTQHLPATNTCPAPHHRSWTLVEHLPATSTYPSPCHLIPVWYVHPSWSSLSVPNTCLKLTPVLVPATQHLSETDTCPGLCQVWARSSSPTSEWHSVCLCHLTPVWNWHLSWSLPPNTWLKLTPVLVPAT